METTIKPLVSPLASSLLTRVLDSFKRDKVLERNTKDHVEKLNRNIWEIESYVDSIVLDDKTILNWYTELKDYMYAAMDALEIYLTVAEKKDMSNMFKNLLYTISIHSIQFKWCTLSLARTIELINEKIDKLLAEARNNEQLKSIKSQVEKYPKQRPTPTSLRTDDMMVGRDDIKNDIILKMKPNHTEELSVKLRILPIVGMGGIGKTTLAQSVFESEKHLFGLKAWVHCPSTEIDVNDLLTKIVLKFGQDASTMSSDLDYLTGRLEEVVRDKTFLLIMDDVWSKEKSRWDELLNPLKKGKTGSTLIITTRDIEVLKLIGKRLEVRVEPEVNLDGLGDDHLWEILSAHAYCEYKPDVPENLERIGRDIIKKLKGLPLAAKAIGGVLGKKIEERHWKEIQKNDLWVALLGKDQDLIPALVVSFLNLPNDAKPFFTYCSLFPKGKEIEERDLVQQWLAHGYLEVKDEESIDDAGTTILEDLQSMSLITRGHKYLKDEGSIEDAETTILDDQQSMPLIIRRHKYAASLIEMHDLIHDTSHYVSRDDHLQILKDGNLDKLPEKGLRHLSMSSATEFREESLVHVGDCKKLRTLIFTGSEARVEISILRTWFKQLRALRVLMLNCLVIEELPDEIGELKHLRYLDLSGNPIKKLPRPLDKLHHLQALILRGCQLGDFSPEEVKIWGQLSRLQNLNLTDNTMQTLPAALTMLSDLRILRLSSCIRLEELPNGFNNLKRLECLDLEDCWSINELPEGLGSLLHLRELDLRGCGGLQSLGSRLANLENLRRLYVEPYVMRRISGEIGSLTSLETLGNPFECFASEINALANLNMLRGGLLIRNFHALQSVAEAQQAKLHEKNCLEELCLEWSSYYKDPSFSKKAYKNYIENTDVKIAVAEGILECLKPNENLRVLTIRCYIGKKLPSWLIHLCLAHPKKIHLPFLRSLTIDSSNIEEMCGDGELFPFLERLEFDNLPELSQWGGSFSPRLREIIIKRCPQLKSMPDFRNTPRLHTLRIELCEGLETESLQISLQGLASLGRLNLWCCCRQMTESFLKAVVSPHLEATKTCGIGIDDIQRDMRIVKGTHVEFHCRGYSNELVMDFLKSMSSGPSPLTKLYIWKGVHLIFGNANFGKIMHDLINSEEPLKLIQDTTGHTLYQPRAICIKHCETILSLQEGILNYSLPHVRHLTISDCKNLELPPRRGFTTLSSLETLTLERCPKLRKLSLEDDSALLPSLRQLVIRDCGSLDVDSILKSLRTPLTSLRKLVLQNSSRFHHLSLLKAVFENFPENLEECEICSDDKFFDFYLRKNLAAKISWDCRIYDRRELWEDRTLGFAPGWGGRGEDLGKGKRKTKNKKLHQLFRELKIEDKRNCYSCPRKDVLAEMLRRKPHHRIQALTIEGIHEVFVFDDDLKHLFLNLTSLKILRITYWKDLYSLPYPSSLEKFEIKHCGSIRGLSSLNNPLTLPQPGGSNLRKLLISDCLNLEDPPITGFAQIKHLASLVLINCPKLSKLSVDDEGYLPLSLRELEITNCRGMEMESLKKSLCWQEDALIRILKLENCCGQMDDSFVKHVVTPVLETTRRCEITSADLQLHMVIDRDSGWYTAKAIFQWDYNVSPEATRMREENGSRMEILMHVLNKLGPSRIKELFISEGRCQILDAFNLLQLLDKIISPTARCNRQGELPKHVCDGIPNQKFRFMHQQNHVKLDVPTEKRFHFSKDSKSLIVVSCPSLKQLSLENGRPLPAELKSLTVLHCPNLTQLTPEDDSPLPSLHQLIIRDCNSLQTRSIAKSLQIKQLSYESSSDESFQSEQLCDESSIDESLRHSPFYSLRKLVLENSPCRLLNRFVGSLLLLRNLTYCNISSDDPIFRILWQPVRSDYQEIDNDEIVECEVDCEMDEREYIARIEWDCIMMEIGGEETIVHKVMTEEDGEGEETVEVMTEEDSEGEDTVEVMTRMELLAEMLERISRFRVTKLFIGGVQGLFPVKGGFGRLFGDLHHLRELTFAHCMDLDYLPEEIYGHTALRKLRIIDCSPYFSADDFPASNILDYKCIRSIISGQDAKLGHHLGSGGIEHRLAV